MYCSSCNGRGTQDDNAIQTAIEFASYDQMLSLKRASGEDGISYADLRRILGNEAIDCPDCEGKGGALCDCAVYIDIPENAEVGWICRFVKSNDVFVQWGRVQEII